MNAIRTYDGSFTFKTLLDRQQVNQMDKLFSDGGFEADLTLQSLDFSWMGTGKDQVILKLFQVVAGIVKDAEGELRCEIDDEAVDPHFEFFTIKGGQLLLQRGKLVREAERIPQM